MLQPFSHFDALIAILAVISGRFNFSQLQDFNQYGVRILQNRKYLCISSHFPINIAHIPKSVMTCMSGQLHIAITKASSAISYFVLAHCRHNSACFLRLNRTILLFLKFLAESLHIIYQVPLSVLVLVGPWLVWFQEAAQALMTASMAGSRLPGLRDKATEYLNRAQQLKDGRKSFKKVLITLTRSLLFLQVSSKSCF